MKKIALASFIVLAVVATAGLLSTRTTPYTSALSGSDFNPGRIIDDAVFYNSSTLSATQIQTFLNNKVPTCDTNGTGIATEWGSSLTRAQYAASRGWSAPPYTCLKDFQQATPQMEAASQYCAAIPAGTRTGAQIIYDVATACGINPQVLIVLLEKEQSLVTDIWPLSGQYRNATGFACPDTAACDPQYNGFFYQVYYAARQFKVYQAFPSNYNYIAGRTNRIYWQTNLGNFVNPTGNADDASRSGQSACGYQNVYIENQATAALYIYTPYQPNQKALANLRGTGDACSAYGNRNFWRLFNDWFGSTLGAIPSDVYVSDGIYTITNLSSGKAIDVSQAKTTPGSTLELWTDNSSQSQYWRITNTNDGFYSIINTRSGLALDVYSGGFLNGTPIQIWGHNGSCAQKWSLLSAGNGITILSACSGKAIDVSQGAVSLDGAKLQLWNTHRGTSQQWTLKEREGTIVDGVYSIRTSSNKGLQPIGNSTAENTLVTIGSAAIDDFYKWLVVSNKAGYYTIKNTQTGLFLSANSQSATEGTALQTKTRDGSCGQLWSINRLSTGTRISSACTAASVDVSGGQIATNGATIQLWTPHSGSSQIWFFRGEFEGIENSQAYLLANVASGKYLDVSGGRTASGTNVHIWDGSLSNRAQMWRLIET